MDIQITESCKAMLDAFCRSDNLPDELLNSVSLLEQVQDLRTQMEELTSSLKVKEADLQKYKQAYSSIKQTKDDLAASEFNLHNRVADLESKLRAAETIVKAAKEMQSELETYKNQASRRDVDLESLYQDIKALTQGRTSLFSSTKPKLIEVRVITDDPANGSVYFRLIRKNAKETIVKQLNIK